MKMLLSLLMIMSALCVQSQSDFFHIFRKYKNDEGVYYIDLSNQFRKIKANDSKLETTIDAADIYLFHDSQDVATKDKDKLQQLISSHNLDLLVDVKANKTHSKLYVVDKGKYLEEMVGIVHTDNVNVYFFAKGHIVFNELSKLGLDFQSGGELDVLKRIKKR